MNLGEEKKEPPAAILAVDDVEENLVALTALLGRSDVHLLTARSGEQALEQLLRNDVAVALLDVNMPSMDGFELAELMRGSPRTRQIPIIFLTAAPHDRARLFRGYEAGAVDFLHKPIEPHVLTSKVEVFIQLYRQRQKVAEQVELLRQSLSLNEAFVAVLGHDLRNPLATIATGATLLERRAADEATRRTAQRIVRGSQKMARLIDQLLCLARMRSGRGIPLALRETDLRQVVETALEDHDSQGRALSVNVEGDPTGVWDRDRLVQTVDNLIGNALRHGDPQAPVEIRLDGRDPQVVRLSVRNGGVIPPEVLPEVFQPFRSGSGGLGLGLYIVRTFVEAHDGHVRVTSSAAEGTCFESVLPRRTPERPEAAGSDDRPA
jgi:two-component system, sensor histidine kinase and response regulator